MPSVPQLPMATLLDALRGVLAQVAEPIQVLRTILDQAVARTGAERGVFVEVSGAGELDYRVLHHIKPGQLEAGGFSRGVLGRVLETGEAVHLAGALEDAHFGQLTSVRALKASSILCMPIRVRGRIAALVYLEHRNPWHFQEEHQALLETLLDMVAPVLDALQAGREVIQERDRLRQSENLLREEAEESRSLLARQWSFGSFVGRSPAVRALEAAVRKAAASDFPVLLTGESGTGKSIIARVLHHSGPRSGQPFVTVFCPSLQRELVEAELFGHRRGAFTGALADRVGKVQAADGGTLFLDEIGELPLEMQPKLLRLLQEKTYERVGDAEERRADARVIAATNRDLEREVEGGRFRRDLYERLNFVPIRLPPLRERLEDIPALLRHCLDRHEAGRWVEVAPDGLAYLQDLDFAWPGNVRHLEQLAARLTLEGEGGPVKRDALARLLDARPARPAPDRGGDGGDVEAALERGLPALLVEAEKRWLEEALERYPRLTRAELAAKLKISESLLYKKLREYGAGDA